MNKITNYISAYIEKHIALIQLLFLILILVVGILFPVLKIDIQTVIFNLILIVGIEILLLLIRYDSLMYTFNTCLNDKSINENSVSISVDEDSYLFPKMLSQVEHDLFISGITCNSVWAYTSELKEILNKGYKIRILISSESAFQSNTLIYKGNDFRDSVNNTKNKIKLLANNIIADEQLRNFFDNKSLEIKTSKIPFTVGFIATNIYDNNIKNKQIKITHYIPKHERAKCPYIVIDSVTNNTLFIYYLNSIKDLWDTSDPLIIQ